MKVKEINYTPRTVTDVTADVTLTREEILWLTGVIDRREFDTRTSRNLEETDIVKNMLAQFRELFSKIA